MAEKNTKKDKQNNTELSGNNISKLLAEYPRDKHEEEVLEFTLKFIERHRKALIALKDK